MERIIILGGGYGGAMAASRLAQRGTSVTLIDAWEGLVERIRLHQVAAGDDFEPVPFSRLFGKLPVNVIRARVESIDAGAHVVHTSAGAVRYDKLVYALGSAIDDQSVPGVREYALTLSGVEGAKRIRARLATAHRVVIAGGGLTAVEVATEIAERWPEVAVEIISANGVGPKLSAGADRHLRDVLTRLRIRVREMTRIAGIDRAGVTLASGEVVAADLVIWCGGFRATPIASESGLEVNAIGQIVVDDYLRSSAPDIYAIGDAATFRNLGMQCATAMPMGAYVADVIAGQTSQPFSFGYVATCISLGRNDGILQLKNPDDTPRERFLSGRPAAWMKELICRFTVMSVRMERMGVRYRWSARQAA